jgi:hypothetical protein
MQEIWNELVPYMKHDMEEKQEEQALKLHCYVRSRL